MLRSTKSYKTHKISILCNQVKDFYKDTKSYIQIDDPDIKLNNHALQLETLYK